uniref:Carboxypeptidase regulatory-like domain-containing protein n=1 Tax=candidate division WOR-3 bacterium TaxID=2052148 RepID=A0A7C4U6S1_UNCW3
MKKISILICFFIVISLNATEEAFPFYTRISITNGNAKTNNVFSLTHSLISDTTLPMTLVIYEIPKGIEFISGKLIDTIFPYQNDSFHLTANLKITQPGAYCITVHTIIDPKDTISLSQHFTHDLYIISDTDTVIYSETPDTNRYYNIFPDTVIGEEPLSIPSVLSSSTISGQIRYYNQITHTYEPLSNNLVEIVTLDGRGYHSTYTDENGNYSITGTQGKYYLIIPAKNVAGEVHPFWKVKITTFPWPPYMDVDFKCSPQTYFLWISQINLYSNLTLNVDFTGGRADIAGILWQIKKSKEWMLSHTGRTLDYVEVAYPPKAEVYVRYLPGYPFILVYIYDLTGTGGSFYANFSKVEEVKLDLQGPLYWGIGLSYRHPHQIVINEGHIWLNDFSVISHEWSHGFMVSTLGNKLPYGWGYAEHW